MPKYTVVVGFFSPPDRIQRLFSESFQTPYRPSSLLLERVHPGSPLTVVPESNLEKARDFRIQLTRGFLDFAEETGLVEEGRGKEGKGGRSGATNTGGGMRELKNLVRRENHTRKIVHVRHRQ